MSTRSNVTTPGGFFVGLGGIAVFCVVSAVVYNWVRTPDVDTTLRPQQVALGLRTPPDVHGPEAEKKQAEVSVLLSAAAQRYNGGTKLDLDKLDDLRGVVRYREAEKSNAEGVAALTSPVAWKGDKAKGEVTMPIDLAMKVVADGLKDRKPKPSAVKLDVLPPLDPSAPPMMPNRMGGGVKTVIFADPNAQPPAEAPAPVAPPAVPPSATVPPPAPVAPPATPPPAAAPITPPASTPPPSAAPPPATPPVVPPPPAPAPAPAEPAKPAAPPTGGAASPAGIKTAANVAVPNRPPLLNWSESKK